MCSLSSPAWEKPIIPDPPNEFLQRKLVLLSKVLQNLANGVQFGDKEDFMAPLNSFLEGNTDALYKFFDLVAVGLIVFRCGVCIDVIDS